MFQYILFIITINKRRDKMPGIGDYIDEWEEERAEKCNRYCEKFFNCMQGVIWHPLFLLLRSVKNYVTKKLN